MPFIKLLWSSYFLEIFLILKPTAILFESRRLTHLVVKDISTMETLIKNTFMLYALELLMSFHRKIHKPWFHIRHILEYNI